MTKRANGMGAITVLPGRRLPFRATMTVGWTLDGRPVRRSRFAATRGEAEEMLREMSARLAVGRPIPDDRLTLRAYLPAWLARRAPAVRATTVRTWSRAIDAILRELGTARVRHLRPSDVEAALAHMTPWTARGARAVLANALRDAERDGIVDRNVAALARPPKVTAAEIAVPGEAEARRLVAVAPTHRLGALVVVALGTGLRQGEILGLTRECLDLDAGTARIDWSLAWIDGEPVLGRPKTATSRRVIPLAPAVVAVLRAHLAAQARERLAAGRRWRDADGLVFTTAEGRPVHPNTARFVLDELCAAAGLPHYRFHALRHAALTIATERAGQKAAQALAGHARITTTDIYARPSDALERAAVAALEEVLG